VADYIDIVRDVMNGSNNRDNMDVRLREWVSALSDTILRDMCFILLSQKLDDARRTRVHGVEKRAVTKKIETSAWAVPDDIPVGSNGLALTNVEIEAIVKKFQEQDPTYYWAAYNLANSKEKRKSAYFATRWVNRDKERIDTVDRSDNLNRSLEEIRSRSFEQITTAMNTFADELKIEWTTELLDSEISLPDGTRVLWGDATIEQHEARKNMLTNQAVGIVETAAKHEKAISELRQAGKTHLRELVSDD